MDSYYADGGALVADPSNAQVFYSGGNGLNGTIYSMCVSKTTNGGTSWTRSFCNARTGFTYSLLVDPASPNIVYAGGSDSTVAGLFRSTNGGTSWTSISTGITGNVVALVRDPVSGNIIYAATSSGVFKTTNSGTSWTNTGCANAKTVMVDPNQPSIVYAGASNGFFRSTTAGGSWTAMNQGLQDLNVTCIGMNPGSYLFAGTYAAGVHRWLFTGIEENTGSAISCGFVIKPNPTAGRSMISYALPRAGTVRLVLYDNQGRLVKTLVTAVQDAGIHSITCHTDQLAAGVYFIELATPETRIQQKVVVVR